MLYNNYVQALVIIQEDGQDVREGLQTLGLTVGDLESYYTDEAQHFRNLGKEKEEDLHAVAYIELLQKYRAISKELKNASDCFHQQLQTPEDFANLLPSEAYNKNLSQTRKTETNRCYLTEKKDELHYELVQLKCAMHIPEGKHWMPSDPEYLKTLEYMNIRAYQQALENLHKLVVQRLYELHRLNLSQTGYKMHTHIANALQKHSKAIRKAVKQYNMAALALKPPRPTLDWGKISHLSFLDQFNILRDSRNSLFDKPWSKPVIRELIKKHHRVTRAHEEIECCNVELCQIHTSIVDEDQHFTAVLKRLESDSYPFYGAVHEYILCWRRIHKYLLEGLQKPTIWRISPVHPVWVCVRALQECRRCQNQSQAPLAMVFPFQQIPKDLVMIVRCLHLKVGMTHLQTVRRMMIWLDVLRA
ncbi:hypothetical protein VKT23_019452 [Stygiomarasmius scandens]|uniref:Uncharacterized protein n=1 Tax=Marasmiellus scandens TaxID=2682957 RepID=A0ABR1IL76_9AGAR